MLEEELRSLLRELVHQAGLISAEITSASADDEDRSDVQAFAVPLGGGSFLRAFAPAKVEQELLAPQLESCARALRTCGRRWEAKLLPPVAYARTRPLDQHRIRERIEVYLQALVNTQSAVNALVTVRGELVASAQAVATLEEARLPLLLKQAEAEVARHRGETAHIEIMLPDVAVWTFWVDAALLLFFTADYAPDFVRHRSRMVMRELAQLLPHLEDDPPEPAKLAPVPE